MCDMYVLLIQSTKDQSASNFILIGQIRLNIPSAIRDVSLQSIYFSLPVYYQLFISRYNQLGLSKNQMAIDGIVGFVHVNRFIVFQAE